MMPPTSRLLYYDLGMNADDDGFCEHFVIMKMTDATPDDLRILQARGLVKVFDDKVLIITDWKENNYIQKDRYTLSKYLEIYKEELKQLSSGKQNVIPNGNQMDKKCIQDVNTGKDRLGKDRKDNTISKEIGKNPSYGNPDINYLINLLKEKFELKQLDGTIKENRNYCRLAINKFKKQEIENAISIGAKNEFWHNKITGFRTLYYNVIKITATAKQQKVSVGKYY